MEDVKYKTRLWVKILLIISLCLNMAIVGLTVGAAYKWYRDGPVPMHQYFGSVGLGGFSGSFGEGDRNQLKVRLADRKGAFEKHQQNSKQEFENLISILSSDNFDQVTLDEHFANQRNMSLQRMEDAHSLLSSQIADMTPEERIAVAERMQKGFSHGKGRRSEGNYRGWSKHGKDSHKERWWKFW